MGVVTTSTMEIWNVVSFFVYAFSGLVTFSVLGTNG